MSTSDEVAVFGVASSGVVEQWDGHFTPTGILLRWFALQGVEYPDLGWDIYRGSLSDIPPLPFNDLNVPFVEGKPSWTYADRITLECATGLHFEPSSQPGWWRLVVPGSAPVPASVVVRFSSPAWHVQVLADAGTSDLKVQGLAAGIAIRQETLTYPGQKLDWRTRGVEQLILTGTGTVYLIAFHLLGDGKAWQLLAHRCLPVINPAYPCGPQPGGTEADEARSRLPKPVAAEWATRFDASFAALLPSLRRLAVHAPAAPIPADPAHPDAKVGGDEREIIALSSLNPHGARILGLAYDDPLSGALDGREYVYKVAGRWLGARLSLGFRRPPPRAELLRKYDLEYQESRPASGLAVVTLRFRRPVHDFTLELPTPSPVDWTATVSGGGASLSGTAASGGTLAFADLIELRLSINGPRRKIGRARWRQVTERVGLLPGIVAVEPGPPTGPPTLTATVVPAASPSAITTSDLDWPLRIAADGSLPEGEPVAYQIGHRRLSPDPGAPAPAPGAIQNKDLLYEGSPIFVSAERALQPPGQRALHTDRNEGAGLAEGWWGWWLRGMDIFGRVSAPSAWAFAPIRDTAPPPAPIMVQAEWVQRNLPAATVTVLGRSAEAKRWLNSSAADEGLIAAWAFGPDEAGLRPDVDGFELLLRTAQATPGSAPGDALVYPEPWPAAVARFGPMAIRSSGTVIDPPTPDPVLPVTVAAVQTLAPPPNAKATDPVRSVCVTNLELDGAASVFVGGTLEIGGIRYPIVANGDGRAIAVIVLHAAGAGPAAGVGEISTTAGTLISLTTDVPALAPPAQLRARSGVLVVGAAAARLQVLRVAAGEFLCLALGPAALGDAATWFPVWSAALDDTGFGPRPTVTAPVANAQVAVRAVRRFPAAGMVSTASAPLTVTAVDLTLPVTPTVTVIPFDPANTCARLASRADWYGRSYFTLTWAPQADRQFVVYRALGDEIARLDRLEYAKGGRRTANFPQPEDWPSAVYADIARRGVVIAQLAAIDAAQAVVDATARAESLEAAYAALTIDTQMLLARQDYAWAAYAQVFAEAISAAEYRDTLEGRSHGHWFYRVTSRTPSGIESLPSEPTPPICCPDVLPPAVPLAHLALADDGAVKLRWLASPDQDLDHYDIYAAREESAGAELVSMTPVESYAPVAPEGGTILERKIARDPGEWCFWIVAVDDSGNRSAPSRMLRGRSLVPIPAPPVWVAAERQPIGAVDHVALTWSHPSDTRLACLVERRPGQGGFWAAVSGWLPRGVYAYEDRPEDLAAEWEYRLRVRDHLGQVSAVLPSTTLEAE